ncbi:MAG: hypothetical protein IT323_15995 [Anaerolineae bacterium]|nr:hypothetical protein [Anaerolineae bacterium]
MDWGCEVDVRAQPAAVTDYIYDVALSPRFAQDGTCFAARASGLYRSTDSGASWQSCLDSLGTDAPLAATAVGLSPAFAMDRTVFAGTNGGVFRSTDGGDSWQYLSLGAPPPVVTALTLSPAFATDGVVLAATLDDGVYRSVNRGDGWLGWNFGLIDRHIHCLAVSPGFAQDGVAVIGTEHGLYTSGNGGRSWREVDALRASAPVTAVAFAPDYVSSGAWWAGTGHGALVEMRGAAMRHRETPERPDGERIQWLAPPDPPHGRPLTAVLESQVAALGPSGWQWVSLWPDEGASITCAAHALDGAGRLTLLVGTSDGGLWCGPVDTANSPGWRG